MASCACGRLAENGLIRCTRCRMLHTLGLDDRAHAAEIKNSYRALVRRWHPDRFHHDERLRTEAGAKLSQINVAYDYLKRVPRSASVPHRPPQARQPQYRTTTHASDFTPASAPAPDSFMIPQLINIAASAFFIISAMMGVIHKLREPAPTPSPVFKPVNTQELSHVLDPASVAGTFRGMTFNTASHKGASTVLLVQQDGDRISGCIIVSPPMTGSGPFTGFVRSNVVSFNAVSSNDRMSFVGALISGTISGSVITSDGKALRQSGEFSFTRKAQAEKPIPDRCPTDRDRDVASGKLTMP